MAPEKPCLSCLIKYHIIYMVYLKKEKPLLTSVNLSLGPLQ